MDKKKDLIHVNYHENSKTKMKNKMALRDYFLPMFCLPKKARLKFLAKFIKIYQKKLSVESLFELILKIDFLGNHLEQLNIIEYNTIPPIEDLYKFYQMKKTTKILNQSMNIFNSKMHIFENDKASLSLNDIDKK